MQTVKATTVLPTFKSLTSDSEKINYIKVLIKELEKTSDKSLDDDLVISIFELIIYVDGLNIRVLTNEFQMVFIRLVEDMIRVVVSKGVDGRELVMLNKILANFYINIQPQRQLQFWVLCHIFSQCNKDENGKSVVDAPFLCDFYLNKKPIDEILQQQQQKRQKKSDTKLPYQLQQHQSQTKKGRGVVDTLYENAGFLQKWKIAKSEMDHKHLRYLAILNKLVEDEKMDNYFRVLSKHKFTIMFLKKCKSFPIIKNTSTGCKVSYVCPAKNGKKMQTLYEEYQKIMS
jgi:hypothetical protein